MNLTSMLVGAGVVLAFCLGIGEPLTKLAKATENKRDDKVVAMFNTVVSFLARIIPTVSDLKK